MKAKEIFSSVLFFTMISCLVAVPFSGSIHAADNVIKWKVQSHWPSASPSYKGSLLVIADKLKQRTNGRLILEPYPAGSLVPSKEIFQAAKRGKRHSDERASRESCQQLRSFYPKTRFAPNRS